MEALVGDRLRQVRLSRELSLATVAAGARISTATLSRVETGKQALDIEMFLSLARVLEVAPSELLPGADGGDATDPLAQQISALKVRQRIQLWRDLAAAQRAQRVDDESKFGHHVEELLAQVDFLRQEIEAVQAGLRRKRKK